MGFISRISMAAYGQYQTSHVMVIQSKKVALLNRAIQLAIISYVVGYVLIYQRRYQDFSDIYSSVTTKVKGTAYPNFTDEQLRIPFSEVYRKVWDVADYVVPPQEKDSFFVTTNVLITPNQTQGHCPEDHDFKHIHCIPDQTDKEICQHGKPVRNGNGIMTGRCVPAADKNTDVSVCEVHGWCPVESNALPLGGTSALLIDSQDFTVLVKNSIEYSMFKVRRRNIDDTYNSSYIQNCHYDKDTDPLCPIFRLGTIVKEAGENYSKIAVKGGVVAIIINWGYCNLDFSPKSCIPKYQFTRLDDPAAKISSGWNFRYAHYHDDNRRTLYKAYGIRFVVMVHGQAGKFSVVPLLLNVGSGLALLGASQIICDVILLYATKKKSMYKERKFTNV